LDDIAERDQRSRRLIELASCRARAAIAARAAGASASGVPRGEALAAVA